MKRPTPDFSKPENVSTKEHRIAQLAKQNPMMALNLSHHMDEEWFKEAFRRTRKDGAEGVDGVSGYFYNEAPESWLKNLLNRAKSGTYRAPAVKCVHIPKRDGNSTRPLGIPTFEDKVLQRAVLMAMTPVYEQDFLPCSYGFRPNRSAHQALQTLWEGLMSMGGGYVIDVDIKDYFTTIDHKIIQDLVRKRIRDGVVRRLIGKWLNARISENGQLRAPTSGVPQGGVISPLLSNIYLHDVLDTWFEHQVKPVMKGKAFIVRFADDAVLVFANKTDSDRIFKVLPKRFAKYGLTIHPEKTKMVCFRRGANRDDFEFLGFRHFWSQSRKGNLIIKRKTSSKRFRLALEDTGIWLRKVRHLPIVEQHKTLCQKIRGHNEYYGITGNGAALAAFTFYVRADWHRVLKRRSHTAPRNCEWFEALCKRFPLPKASPVHSIYRHVAKP